MDDKVFTQEVIQDNPWPGEAPLVAQGTPTSLAGTFSPTTTNAKAFPRKRVAVELLSTALNTRSRKILQEFQLQQSGGLQIGNFQEGLSGDVRLTPNGITGRNVAGLTTFGLDTDGNLILIGEMRSGSVISGNVIIEEGGQLQIGTDEGDTIIDEQGIVSANNFNLNSKSGGLNYSFTNTSFSAVTGASTVTLNVSRPTKALITLSLVGSSEQINAGLDCNGRTEYRILDVLTGGSGGEDARVYFYYDSFIEVATDSRENIISKTYSASEGVNLLAGSHTFTLQSRITLDTNFRSSITLYSYTITLLGS